MSSSSAPSAGRTATFTGGLALVMVVGTFAIPALGVLASFMIDDLGLTRTAFGWIISTMAAATAALSTLAGRVADRRGGRQLAVALALLTAASAIGMGLAGGIVALLIAGVISGASNAGSNPATNKLIADRLPTGRRGVVLGIKQSGVQVGFVLVGLAVPPLALAFGWRGALYAMAAFSVAVAIAALLIFEPDVPQAPRAVGGPRYRYPVEVRWLAAYAVLMGAGGSAVSTFLPLYAQESLGYGPRPAGATMAVIGGVGVVSRIVIPRIAERRHLYLATLATMSWLAFGSMALITTASLGPRWLVWTGVMTAGVSIVAWNAVVNLAALSVATVETAGRASGLVNMGFMGGYLLSPVVFGAIVDRAASYVPAWSLTATLYVAAGLLVHVWMARRGPGHGSGVPVPATSPGMGSRAPRTGSDRPGDQK